MMNAYTYGGNWIGHGFLGLLFMIIFWGAVIYFIVHLVNSSKKNHGSNKTALEHLNERYAKGEITKEQFETMKKDIASHN